MTVFCVFSNTWLGEMEILAQSSQSAQEIFAYRRRQEVEKNGGDPSVVSNLDFLAWPKNEIPIDVADEDMFDWIRDRNA